MAATGSAAAQAATQASSYKPRGYHRMAILMGREEEIAIFRRFNELNMLNLLSFQAEILELQIKFRDICQEDDESGDQTREKFSEYFRVLHRSSGTQNNCQYQMLLTIREKMKE
jgi:hypothetical protein